MADFEKYIAMPLEVVKKELTGLGYNVKIEKCSKPKIKTDSELIVSVKQNGNELLLVVGDFLIEEL